MEPEAQTSPENAADASADRARLRAEARAARAELEPTYRAHKSAEICKRLDEALMLTLGITGRAPEDAVVAVYSAFPEEVDLADFIRDAYVRGCRVAFPCMTSDARGIPDAPGVVPFIVEGDRCAPDGTHITEQTMEMRIVPEELYAEGAVPFLNNPLVRFAHDADELAACPYVPADELTLLVVPMVGFDRHGNRLGYGAGNYDRYLAQVPSTCRVAGVAFAEQQVDPIPTEPHDIPIAIISL